METRDSIQDLLALRKVTRAMTDALRGQLTEYLATLTPLLRPRAVLGDYVHGGVKEASRRADAAFKEFQALYATVASSKPFGLARELQPPLDLSATTLEVAPLDYAHVASNGADTRSLMVRSPLKWVVSYTGFGPARLRELIADRGRHGDELQRAMLHAVALNVVFASQPGVTKILEALHFPVTSETSDEFGALPLTCLSAAVSTRRPSDAVILQSAELTGMDAFEEVVNLDDIERLGDSLKQQLLAIAKNHGSQPAVS